MYSEATIREAAKYSDGVAGKLGGILPGPLANALSAFSGQAWQGGAPDVDAWQIPAYLKAESPLIVMLKHHWVIVDGYRSNMLSILDPEPYPPGGPFATEGLLDYQRFFELFGRGGFQVVVKR